MGSITRMNRSNRFIEEFGSDYLAQHPKVGDQLTVTAVAMEQVDGYEDVRILLQFALPDGSTMQLQGDLVFDAEWDEDDDLVDCVAGSIAISEEEAEKRLEKARLIDRAKWLRQ